MTTSLDLAAAVGPAIAQRIGASRYRLWFAENTRFHWDGAQLTVGVPNRFYQEWLHNTFRAAVAQAAESVLGQAAAVAFVIEPALFQARRTAELAEPILAPPPRAHRATDASARRWLRLDDFIIGAGNQLAAAAAKAMVERPAQAANPLTLHGPVGVGKTHLLEGIYAGLRARTDEDHLRYLSAEEFTNRFLEALRGGKLGGFRRHFRDAHALVVDEVHFFANKQATQEEFLHTFDALVKCGRPVVVSCECHPRLIPELLPELTDRLLGGGVWALEPPDVATRRAILRAKALALGCPVPGEVVRFLAESFTGNVRELEGALHAVHHYTLTHAEPIAVETARRAVGDLIRHRLRAVQLHDVARAVGQVLALEARALHSRSRARAASYPRMLAMHLARKHTGAAFSEIGRFFGGRNHSTAVAADKKVRAWLSADAVLTIGDRRWQPADLVERIERELLR